MVPDDIRYAIPARNSASDICPSDHHAALFFIHGGTSANAGAADADTNDARSAAKRTSIVVFVFIAYSSGSDHIRCTEKFFIWYKFGCTHWMTPCGRLQRAAARGSARTNGRRVDGGGPGRSTALRSAAGTSFFTKANDGIRTHDLSLTRRML